jgi:hypothetical protein
VFVASASLFCGLEFFMVNLSCFVARIYLRGVLSPFCNYRYTSGVDKNSDIWKLRRFIGGCNSLRKTTKKAIKQLKTLDFTE